MCQRCLETEHGALLIQSSYIPRFYALMIATGGPNSDSNPVGFREHIKPRLPRSAPYSGARSVPAPRELLCTRVRHRGAAVVTQITENLSYTPPTIET